MSESETSRFEQTLAFHAAPTLLGIKCGSLLALSVEEYDIEGSSALFGSNAYGSQLRVRTVNRCRSRSLLYVYHAGLLARQLSAEGVREFLAEYGYDPAWSAEGCLDRLCLRLAEQDFPHEIGIFLGYPLEDVKGFIANCGQRCKYCGVWKVYGDVEQAKLMFERYRECRVRLCEQLKHGKKLCTCVA